MLCRSQRYHFHLTPKYSGFSVTVSQTTATLTNMTSLMLIVSICNSNETLASNPFSYTTTYALLWNGTYQQSQLNNDYCFEITSISESAVPIQIDFEVVESELVLEYSSINVGGSVVFETDNMLVLVDLRDQWNNTVAISSVFVFDQEGNQVGTTLTETELQYNATLNRGQIISRRSLYLKCVNGSYPHTTFYGND